MDKMVMYNASAIHPALGPRADQIGFSKGESGNHQVIMACDVIFRVGAEEPTGQGEQQTVDGMNGYSLWKWIAGELGEIPLEFCGNSEEALSVQAQFDERKESLVDRVQQAVLTLVRTKTTGKTGLLIARRSALETEHLKDLVRLLTYTKPLANDGLFTR